MMLYLFKSTLCMAIFLGIYHLVFAREKIHQFKRGYLLGALAFSLIIPLITVHTEYIEFPLEQNAISSLEEPSTLPLQDGLVDIKATPFWNADFWLPVIYMIGLVAMLIRFVFQLGKIIRLKQKSTIVQFESTSIYLHPSIQSPFSFLNWFFLNKNDFEKQQIDEFLFNHEIAHIKQHHSLDILLVELLHCLFWVNPILPFYKKAIKLNHEYLADAAVLQKTAVPTTYMHLLIDQAGVSKKLHLASALHYGQTKKRLNMMLQQSRKPQSFMKMILVLPLLFGLIWVFGQTREVPKSKPVSKSENVKGEKPSLSNRQSPVEIEDGLIRYPGNEEILIDLKIEDLVKRENKKWQGGMMAFKKGKEVNGKTSRRVVVWVHYNQMVSFQDASGKEVVKVCNELTDAERLRFWQVPESKAKYLQVPYPPSVRPTAAQMEDFLNPKKYGVWLNGKQIDNAELKKYKPEDIYSFGTSILHKNAYNYGKHEYQLNIQTRAHFEQEYVGRMDGWWDEVVLAGK